MALPHAPAAGRSACAPGTASRTVTVMVVGDGLTEPDETMEAALPAPVNAAILTGARERSATTTGAAPRRGNGPSRPSSGGRAPAANLLELLPDLPA